MSNKLNWFMDTFGRRQTSIVEDTPNIIDENTADITYIGWAKRGSLYSDNVWKIKKITTSGTITTMGFPEGKQDYDYSWDDRLTYTYL